MSHVNVNTKYKICSKEYSNFYILLKQKIISRKKVKHRIWNISISPKNTELVILAISVVPLAMLNVALEKRALFDTPVWQKTKLVHENHFHVSHVELEGGGRGGRSGFGVMREKFKRKGTGGKKVFRAWNSFQRGYRLFNYFPSGGWDRGTGKEERPLVGKSMKMRTAARQITRNAGTSYLRRAGDSRGCTNIFHGASFDIKIFYVAGSCGSRAGL